MRQRRQMDEREIERNVTRLRTSIAHLSNKTPLFHIFTIYFHNVMLSLLEIHQVFETLSGN